MKELAPLPASVQVAAACGGSLFGVLLLTGVLTCASIWIGCQNARPPRRLHPNLLLVVVDTLRADHLGCYGSTRDTSPQIDALATESVRYTRAYAAAPWTKPAVASMMTGLYPSHHGVDRMLRVLPDSASTLAEVLRQRGYRTAGVVSHTLIGKQFGYDQGFEIYDESEAQGHRHISTPGVIRRARELLRDFESASAPFFLFVHLFDPHDTYLPHPEFGFAAARAGRIKAGRGSSQLRQLRPPPHGAEIQLLRDLYDEEIRFTDQGLALLLGDLRSAGELDQTLVVLVADHGEEFFERGWLGHGSSLFDELLRVPLLVRLPGGERAGTVETKPVSVVGLMATSLEMLGLGGTAGNLDVPSFARVTTLAQPIYAELNYAPHGSGMTIPKADDPWLRAVIDGRYKLIYDRLQDRARLFDLVSDSAESTDVADRFPERVAAMRQMLRAAPRADSGLRLAPNHTTLSDAQKELLRKLGY